MQLWLIGIIPGLVSFLGGLTLALLTDTLSPLLILGQVVLGVVVSGASGWLLHGLLHVPLCRIASMVGKMQATGDLSCRVADSRGPAGILASRFNQLVESIQGIIGKVIFDALRVGEAGDVLTRHARAVADDSAAQRSAAADMVRTIADMTQGIEQVEEHARQAALNAEEALELSQAGARVVGQAAGEIDRVSATVEHAAQLISALDQRSAAIGGIVKVIGEIASQTNLLALNAAIEAARAGEQGRGFAVVADEVRSLAVRTSQSTSEISTMIGSIQEEIRRAVETVLSGSTQARSGADLALQAARALENINQGASRTKERIDGIAAEIAQQGQDASAVSRHIQSIMEMTERNAEGAGETLHEAQALASLAVNLQEIRKVFLLGPKGEQAMERHRGMPEVVRQLAATIGRQLEAALEQGRIRENELFDSQYRPLPGTDPQKFSTGFDGLTDQLFPPIQEPVLQQHAWVAYAIGCDRNGYVPTHNQCYSRPLTGDHDTDLVHNRTKRIFDDPVGRQCGQHELPFLIQTYRRDTGEIMHDISAPVYVRGRHWGGFRIGYRT